MQTDRMKLIVAICFADAPIYIHQTPEMV